MRPRAEKLPLIVRKDIRDHFEPLLETSTAKASELLGRPYTISFDPYEVFPYAETSDAKERTGQVLAAYLESFVSGLELLIKNYPEDGVDCFNEAVTQSQVTLTVDDTGQHSYVGCDVKNGVLRILFSEHCLGSNVHDVGRELLKAINDASGS